jgi:hypothetical protein
MSENKSIKETVSEYNQTVFGTQQKALQDYITKWIIRGPMFGRETSEHFFILGKQKEGAKFEPTKVTLELIQKRMDILKEVNQSDLSGLGRKMFNYYSAMELFYLNLFQNQDKFYQAYAMLERKSLDSAKLILKTVSPEKAIELYAKASTIMPITSGEKALIISLGTRWLPDFVNLKQRARMAGIYYKFEATQHDTLAQGAGSGTYFIDKNKTLWMCLGKKELHTGNAGFFDKKEAVNLPENSLTYVEIATPITIPLVTIGKNILAQGKYNFKIQYLNSPSNEDNCKLFIVVNNIRSQLQTVSVNTGSKLKTISATIEIKDAGKYTIDIDPGNVCKQFTNLIINPI